MDDLFTWIDTKLKSEGWSNRELARRSGLSPTAINATLNGRNAVTWEFCAAIAKAFRVAPEQMFRKAGLLTTAPGDETMKRLTDHAKHLSPDNLELLIDMAQFLYKRQEG